MTPPVPAQDGERASIPSTYDHRVTGDRFSIETRVNGRLVSTTSLRDPFVHHRVVIGWRDLLRGLLHRRAEVLILVSGDAGIVEDVCELDDDYLGLQRSSRRREWNERVQDALRRASSGGAA